MFRTRGKLLRVKIVDGEIFFLSWAEIKEMSTNSIYQLYLLKHLETQTAPSFLIKE